MKKLFVKQSEAFYGFGKIMGLSPLPLDDLVTYLLNTLEKEGFEMDEETAFYLARKVAGHPHYFKILAQAVLDRLPREKFTIEKRDVDLGYQEALDQGRGELDTVWSSLSRASLQRQVLKFLAWEESKPYSNTAFPSTDKAQIYFALTDLERKGILKKRGRGKYAFVNPFFPDYLRRFSEGSF